MALRVDSLAVVVTQLAGAQGRLAEPEEVSFSLVLPAVALLEYGRKDAPVTVVEFTDYQCPFCAQFAERTWPLLRDGFVADGTVRHLVVDLPLESIHPQASLAARAIWCADQHAPVEASPLRELLYEYQTELAPDRIRELLDRARFPAEKVLECAAGPAAQESLDRSLALAGVLGFSGTPTFVVAPSRPDGVVEGRVIRGAAAIGDLQAAIEYAGRQMSPAEVRPIPGRS